VVLLRRAPASAALAELLDDVLRYVVDLSRPRTIHGLQMPGWYVPHDPAPGARTPAGHVNNTMPDGAAGLLAFLALCTHAGHRVVGQNEAIAALLAWFALTRQDGPDGAWWPTWVAPDEIPDLHAGRPLDAVAPPPSWSGLAGMARAVQMGAGTVRNREAIGVAESVIAGCLTSRQMDQLTEPGLRDGLAGLYQVGRRAAAGSMTLTHRTAAVGDILRDLVAMADAGAVPGIGDGLLTGATGLRLAAQTMRRVNGPPSVWDSCLLIA
jgi:hypothetical protein